MLNNVLYGDLTGVFLVVGCTLFISLVNCLSEIPSYLFLIQYFINLGPLVLKATSLWFFIHSFIDNGVDRTRPASNGLNPAQVPF